jgi:hypothetical protein
MTHDGMIAVIQASKEGKLLEVKSKGKGVWHKALNPPAFNFYEFEYRVMQGPRISG